MNSLGESLQKLLISLGIEKAINHHKVIEKWPDIVGPRIARHTIPEKVDFNKLYVKVTSPSWRHELNYQKKRILNKINSMVKNASIEEIIFK